MTDGLQNPKPKAPVEEVDYLMFEVMTVQDVIAKEGDGSLPLGAKVYVGRDSRKAESREAAIEALAKDDDREGTRYSATTSRYFLEDTPQKSVDVTWKAKRK